MKTRTSKKFTKRKTSKKKSIVPYVVGGIAVVGTGIGTWMLYKHYMKKKRVLVIDSISSSVNNGDNKDYGDYKNDKEYKNYIADKEVTEMELFGRIQKIRSYDEILIIYYPKIKHDFYKDNLNTIGVKIEGYETISKVYNQENKTVDILDNYKGEFETKHFSSYLTL